MVDLSQLAERVEAATGDIRAINREVALAVGWHRYSPSEIGKKNPGWIAPEDFIGEYVGKDGRRTPKLDSLHGTEIWREPRNYIGSADAAMTLIPAHCTGWSVNIEGRNAQALLFKDGDWVIGSSDACSPAAALVAASLRAALSSIPKGEKE